MKFIIVFLLGMITATGIATAVAQQATAPPTPEQQLEQCQAQNIRLRKELAQEAFRSASVEEQALAVQKQLAAEKAKNQTTAK